MENNSTKLDFEFYAKLKNLTMVVSFAKTSKIDRNIFYSIYNFLLKIENLPIVVTLAESFAKVVLI